MLGGTPFQALNSFQGCEPESFCSLILSNSVLFKAGFWNHSRVVEVQGIARLLIVKVKVKEKNCAQHKTGKIEYIFCFSTKRGWWRFDFFRLVGTMNKKNFMKFEGFKLRYFGTLELFFFYS